MNDRIYTLFWEFGGFYTFISELQYDKHVKPSFEEFILPSKKHADIIIPRGADNDVAIDLIVQHIRTKLGQHDLCKIYKNLFIIPSTFQVTTLIIAIFIYWVLSDSDNDLWSFRYVECTRLYVMSIQENMTLYFMQTVLFAWYDHLVSYEIVHLVIIIWHIMVLNYF